MYIVRSRYSFSCQPNFQIYNKIPFNIDVYLYCANIPILNNNIFPGFKLKFNIPILNNNNIFPGFNIPIFNNNKILPGCNIPTILNSKDIARMQYSQ